MNNISCLNKINEKLSEIRIIEYMDNINNNMFCYQLLLSNENYIIKVNCYY